jgi:uncharacterized protein YqhQ
VSTLEESAGTHGKTAGNPGPESQSGLRLCPTAGHRRSTLGGQAVIEGVMMRGPDAYATAVRKRTGEIKVKTEPFQSWSKKSRFWGLPVLRGCVTLVETLRIGIEALNYSAQEAAELENENAPGHGKPGEGALTWGTVALAIIAGVALFFYLPLWLTGLLGFGGSGFLFNIVAGLVRIGLFLLYVLGISLARDIRRVFEYHGAEHKTVHAHEARADLDPETIRQFSSRHNRCGTSFLMTVLLVAILVFAVVDTLTISVLGGPPSPVLRFTIHLALIPVIAGLSYEAIRFASRRSNNPLLRLLALPGLALQSLTTREPTPDQIEVALRALQAVKEPE